MKLVNLKNSSEFKIIKDEEFDSSIYYDNSNIVSWDKKGLPISDYTFIRDRIREIVTQVGFNNLKEHEKECVVKYCATTDSEIVTYFVMKGYSVVEAKDLFILKRSEDILKAGESYYKRVKKTEFIAAILKYLGQEQGEQVMTDLRNFMTDIKEIGRLGINYNGTQEGIMDYIEGTGSFVGGGLEQFIYSSPDTIDNLRKTLKDILYFGYTT